MHVVAIVGSRHRGWQEGVAHAQQVGSPADEQFVRGLLTDLRTQHPNLLILSTGCDVGFGRMVRQVTESLQIPFGEFMVRLNAFTPREQHVLLWLARHAALVDVATEYHIFVVQSRLSYVEDLVQRVRDGTTAPYTVYSETLEVLDQR